MRTVFQRRQKTTLATSNGSSSSRNSLVRTITTPATMLAFLLAIVMSVLVIKGGQALQSQSSDYTPEAAVDSQSGATEQSKVVNDDTSSESTPSDESATSNVGSGVNSVTTRTVIENGQASVEMEVNGQEVPVNQNGSSHHSINHNDGQTDINVNVQNGQSGASSSTFTSNSSSSSLNSSSFQSQSVWVNP